MITILGAGGAIGVELAKLLVASNQPFRLAGLREFGFAGTPYADGVRATAAAFQRADAAKE
jgi:hypothetical protein